MRKKQNNRTAILGLFITMLLFFGCNNIINVDEEIEEKAPAKQSRLHTPQGPQDIYYETYSWDFDKDNSLGWHLAPNTFAGPVKLESHAFTVNYIHEDQEGSMLYKDLTAAEQACSKSADYIYLEKTTTKYVIDGFDNFKITLTYTDGSKTTLLYTTEYHSFQRTYNYLKPYIVSAELFEIPTTNKEIKRISVDRKSINPQNSSSPDDDYIVAIDRVSFVKKGISSSAVYKLFNKKAKKSLDIKDKSISNGGLAHIWRPYDGTQSQQWNLGHVGNNYYTIGNVNSNKVIDIKGQQTGNGVEIHQWQRYNGASNQEWYFVPAGGIYYQLINRKSGRVIDVKDTKTHDGALAHQWDKLHDWESQMWSFTKE